MAVDSSDKTASRALPKRLGIVAGEGDFPLLIAQAARSMGIEVVVFAIRGLGSEKLQALAERHF